jgi:hypothetical protein
MKLKQLGDLSTWFVYAAWLAKGLLWNLWQNGFWQKNIGDFSEEAMRIEQWCMSVGSGMFDVGGNETNEIVAGGCFLSQYCTYEIERDSG